MARDVKKIASTVDIVNVINDIVPLAKHGNKYVGICPFHNDHKSSLTVSRSKQRFKCFACGTGGDVVDYFMRMGNSFHDAVDKIEFKKNINTEFTPIQIEKSKPQWSQILRPNYFPKKIRHPEFGKPSFVWGYHNGDGYPMGYVCRFDTQDDKEIVPYVYATNGKIKQWRWLGFNKPRPLYNLPQLINEPDRPVVIVEGEKAADHGKLLFRDYVVVSWQGGAEAVRYTDFTPLNGRNVIFIPDNDKPGFKAMFTINELVVTAKSLFIDTSVKPLHWDVADEPDWTTKDAIRFIKHNMVDKLKIKEDE